MANLLEKTVINLGKLKNAITSSFTSNDYSHIDSPKSRLQLVQISAAVMGIEFCYAAETAFVSPILLNFGLSHTHMTLIWCLSPIFGFFLTPSLGVLSDNCPLKIGRRLPFVFILSIGIVLGLILVPNGKDIGKAFGDNPQLNEEPVLNLSYLENNFTSMQNVSYDEKNAPWGLFFTVMGTVLLDFDSDACQSPARAYLLDVTLPDDHAKGLSTFTIMAGMGGALGYALGAINWNSTAIGIAFGGHIRAVFTLILIIFIICVFTTLCSFREKPLGVSDERRASAIKVGSYKTFKNEESEESFSRKTSIKSSISEPIISEKGLRLNDTDTAETSFTITSKEVLQVNELENNSTPTTLRQYFYSIIFMPPALRIICLTNLFCWMSLVCYSLYFTDFVGETIFKGNPRAAVGSPSYIAYEDGIRFGCWGMALYSISCSVYSFLIDKLINRFGAKLVYIGGQLIYSFGMVSLALLRHPAAAIILSSTAGIMYSTLFTMPYLLIAHYHSNDLISMKNGNAVRGLGTDVAIVSSMVFLAQFILSACMGSLVNAMGSTVVVVCLAAILSFCGAISATQVFYSTL